MCNENNDCKAHYYDTNFQDQKDLLKYRDWLKQELEIVEKALQDIREETI